MRNASMKFKEHLQKKDRKLLYSAEVKLQDGTVLNLNNDNLMQSNGFKINGETSGNDSFDIGFASIGRFSLTIDNMDDKFSAYDFTGAVAENVKTGMKLEDGTIESLNMGKFYLNEPKYNGSIITLEFYDSMSKFDTEYSKSTLQYPATLLQIVMDACDVCDVPLGTPEFEQSDYVVQNRPDDSSLTFRQVLLWVGQISCHFCSADSQGRLALQWYDTATLESIDIIDGNSNSDADIIDGGTYAPWTSGDVLDGGDFVSTNKYHHIYSFSSLSVSTDDVVITGVRVEQEIEGENGTEKVIYQAGNDGYVLSVSGNKLIQGEGGNTVASMLGEKLIGLRFRPFSASCLSDPTIEPGDIALISDRKGNVYPTLITSTTFQAGNYQGISCGAETPARNSATRFSQITQVYVDYRKELQKERTERETALEGLKDRIDNSSGTFTTTETQPDGSKIHYLHNKPSLAESDIIWKMTAEAWGVSTDGGETYNGGMTVDGDTIVRILTATGVNAEWINTGALVVKDADGNVIFSADMDTGQVIISGSSVRIGESNVVDVIGDVRKEASDANQNAKDALEQAAKARNMSMQLNNDYQNIPVDSNGEYVTFPECTVKPIVMYGTEDITENCVYTTTKSSGVTGSWNNTTKTYTVTALATDQGWVDIKATYLGMLTVIRRFSIAKLYAGADGEDSILLQIESSNGNIFKNTGIATTLTVSILAGNAVIDSSRKMYEHFGSAATLEWESKKNGETEFLPIQADDPRISDAGFIFTLHPNDVKEKNIFRCKLNY